MTDIATYRRSMTEDQMLAAIRDVVERRGGRVFHIRDSRRAPETADMPDVLLILPPFVGVLELKSMRRKITPGQADVLALLEECDRLLTGIVRPERASAAEYGFDMLLDILKGDWT